MGHNRIRAFIKRRVYVSNSFSLNVSLIEKSPCLRVNLYCIWLTVGTTKFDPCLIVPLLRLC